METPVPPQPRGSFRVVLQLTRQEKRLDTVLLAALRAQKENLDFANITRTTFKKLFDDSRIQIKGQNARPSSALSKGLTYVDILAK